MKIKGVDINLDSKELLEAATVEDIRKLEIFSHLSEEEREEAENELASELGI